MGRLKDFFTKKDEKKLERLEKGKRYISETSAKQVFNRLAGTWTYWGWKGGYFSSEKAVSYTHLTLPTSDLV